MTIKSPDISIVIATYNSGKILPLVLQSIKTQTYDRELIETIMVDGGSSDNTLNLGKKFGCRILVNPKGDPVNAKYLGYIKAKGKYIVFIDHDEVLLKKDSLEKKVNILENDKRVKAIFGGNYKNPPYYNFISQYISEFGDPFSFYYYHLSKDYRYIISDLCSRYNIVNETEEHVLFLLNDNNAPPINEYVAGAGMINKKYFYDKFPETLINPFLVPHLFYLQIKDNKYFCILKNDIIMHYSSDSLSSYIKKIKWRIINNIFNTEKVGVSGYSGREKYFSEVFNLKKYLFIPYAFSVVFPLCDSIGLCITRKNISYLLHLPLTVLTAILIILYYLMKLFGYTPVMKNYDGTKVVE